MKQSVIIASSLLLLATACGPSTAELKEKANAGDNAALVAWGNTDDPEGMFTLAQEYLKGDRVTFNSDSAIMLFQAAADKDYTPAINQLADFYLNGAWVEENPEKAFAMYEKLAGKDDAYALYMVGVCYYQGYGTDYNEGKGLTNLEKASSKGLKDAKTYLAGIYSNKDSHLFDSQKALKIYREMAESGEVADIDNLAFYLVTLEPSEENDREAVELWKKGAEKDDANSIYNLGWSAENGRGVEADIEAAKEYYQRAAALGNENAIKAIDRLTPKQFMVGGHTYQGKTKFATDFGGINHNTEIYFYHGGSYTAKLGGGINILYERGVYRQNGNTINIIREDGSEGTLTMSNGGRTLSGTISRGESGTLTLVK